MRKFILIITCFFCCLISLKANVCSGCLDGFEQGGTKIQTDNTFLDGIINVHLFRASELINKLIPINQVCSGINIHFVTGQEKDLDMIADAGFRFIRMDFSWQDIERTKGNYNWAAYDELTANLIKRGLGAIYILDYSNSLYEDQVNSSDPLTNKEQKDIASPRKSESIAAFARWASASAGHFKGSNIIWEIWNEPNIFFWKPKPDVRQYIALALATCKAVRSAVPDASIIGPASSEIPMPYLESFLASGVLEYLDAVSVHPYRDYSKSPETAAADYKNLRELIEHYAPPDKKKMPIISSEWGYSSSSRGVSSEKQEAYIVRMQLSNLLNGIPVSIWYDWKNDGDDPMEHEQNFGTVTSDLKPKPAYTAILTMNMQLKGFTFLRRINLKSDNDYALLFKNDNGTYKISAWTMAESHSVMMNEIIPKAAGISARDGNGNVLKLITDNGSAVIELNELPQYITLQEGIRID
jgi:hypothetical protein